MIHPTTLRLLPFLLFFILLTACDDDEATPGPATLRGPQVDVGDGDAWTEVTFGPDGAPSTLAVVFTEGALDNLPTGAAHAHEFLLPLPAEADIEPYTHATLDWNQHGHAPPGVYDVPHFDIHFYFISEAERNLIGPHDTLEFNRPLPEEQLPPMYLETPGGVPRMGAHVIDLQSPEVAGTGDFTHTLIYGKYDGELNFLEPMVAESFLRTRPDITVPVRRPQSYGRSGYYPDTYQVSFDPSTGTYRVGLLGLSYE